jgi:tRNA U34 5-methylaminomethyl-2-thiouridine-forming methyltransferase MnmC
VQGTRYWVLGAGYQYRILGKPGTRYRQAETGYIYDVKKRQLNKIITTSDGSHTIFVPELNEHYHSIHGAVQESDFIFIKNGFDLCKSNPLNIFEVGFGTGLNALLTAVKSMAGKREVNYTSIEKYPVDEKIIRSLNHYHFAGEKGKEICNSIHSSPWNINANICKNFNLNKIKGDFTVETLSGNYDLIYFDAFGPDKQPEMWTKELFAGIASITNKNGILVTYSAKGEVKRNLRDSGFEVALIPGPPGKRQMIRAVKI